MTTTWEPTHVSVLDGSPARLIGVHGHGHIRLDNEDGYRWSDPESAWEPIDATPVHRERTPDWGWD